MTDIILVTGSAGVLGQAVTAHLASLGARVLGLDLAQDMPVLGQARFAGGIDLADPQAVDGAVADLTRKEGRLSGLVNVAGGFVWETVADGEIDTWDRMYRMNLRTVLTVTRACLPLLRLGQGAVVNIGAAASARAAAGMGAYAASKSGVARLTEALAQEEMDNGVRINAILPSILDTPTNRRDMPEADFARWVDPGAIAETVAFLISNGARDITGASLPVTGRC